MSEVDKIINKIKKDFKPVYLVYSEEEYLLKEFKDKFINTFIDQKIRDFNLTKIDDQENFAKKIKNYILTVPMTGSTRYIIARCENYFVNKNKDDGLLISLLEKFPKTAVLLVLIQGSIDQRLKINKTLKKTGEIIKLEAPRYQQLDKWIQKKFTDNNKRIEQKGIKFLEHMFNNNLQRLDKEIEKIITCYYEKDIINYQDIRKIISKDRLLEDNVIFSFLDAMSGKEKGKSLKILDEMIRAGEHPLKIVAMIGRQIRLLMCVKELKEKGYSPDRAAKILDEHPYPIKKCFSYCDNFQQQELEVFLENILEANYDLVTGKYIDRKMALELTLLKI